MGAEERTAALTAAARVLEAAKAKADRALRLEDPVAALEHLLPAMQHEEVRSVVVQPLRALALALADAGDVFAAACASAAILLLQPDDAEAERALAAATCGVAGDEAAATNLVTALCDGASPVLAACARRGSDGAAVRAALEQCAALPALGRAISCVAQAARAMRLWPQLVVCGVVAPVFCADVAARCADHACLAFAHMNFTHHFALASAEMRTTQLEVIAAEAARAAYDWAALSKGGAATPLAEYRAASLVVQRVDGAGLGLCTTTAMPAGTLVLCEYPIAFFRNDEASPAGAIEAAVARLAALRCGEALLLPATELFTGTGTPGDLEEARDPAAVSSAVADAVPMARKCFLRRPLRFFDLSDSTASWAADSVAVTGAVAKNSCACERYVSQERRSDASVGLFATLALMNHAASPTTVRFSFGNFLFVRTVVDVPAGGELTLSYVPCSRYLESDEPVLQPWGIGSEGRDLDALHRLRAIDDTIGASAAKLRATAEAEPLLKLVDSPVRRTFTTNAGLFAMMARQDAHPFFRRLLLQLQLQPADIWVLALCCRVMEICGVGHADAMLAKLKAVVAPKLEQVFGHSDFAAVGIKYPVAG